MSSPPEKNFETYKFAAVPNTAPLVFPAVPSHNPDPNYRETLLKVINESYEEGQQIQKCLSESRPKLLIKLKQYAKLNKEAKDLLIADGFTGFAGGRRKTRRTKKRLSKKRRGKSRKA